MSGRGYSDDLTALLYLVPFAASGVYGLYLWVGAGLSALLPVTQGGIGVREAVLAGLLAPFGAPPVLTVAVGLAWEVFIISGAVLAGLASFLLGKFSQGR